MKWCLACIAATIAVLSAAMGFADPKLDNGLTASNSGLFVRGDSNGVTPASTLVAGGAITNNFVGFGEVDYWSTVNAAGGLQGHYWLQKTGAGTSQILGALYGDSSSVELDLYTTGTTQGLDLTTNSTQAAVDAFGGLPLVLGVGGVAALSFNTSQFATFGAGMKNAHLSTGTNADFVCLAADGTFLIQASACTISSMRFKNLIGEYKPGAPLATVAKLEPIVFKMKPGDRPNPDPNYERPQIGLSAENVAEIEPRCVIYEDDGTTPKSYRQACLIAILVAGMQAQQRQIDALTRR